MIPNQSIKLFSSSIEHYLVRSRSLYTSSLKMDQSKFSDKPMSFKKFKAKQAEFQKDDGLPVYLKKGASDKLAFNLTLGLLFISACFSVKILIGLDKIGKE